ncbi:WD repeat-containing protein 61 [Infundibulicybe gibba]|nr:WD repeat-containing protein 61 [Infundibulicybe gibba]
MSSTVFLHSHDCSEPHTDAVWGVACTPQNTTISISADGSISQWSSPTGQSHPPNVQGPAPHTLGLVALSVSRDGQRVLYNSIEGLICLWDLEGGADADEKSVKRFESYARTQSEGEPAWSVSLHPAGETYASTGASGNVAIHSAQAHNFGEHVGKLTSGRSKFGMHCVHSPDGNRLAMSSETGQIYVFDLASTDLTATYTAHAMTVRSLSWSPDSTLLLSASDDKRVVLHDVRTAPGGTVAALTGHTSWALSVAFSPDGRLALSGSADKTIKVWDIAARRAVNTLQDTGEVWGVAWAHAPNVGFVSGGEDGVVRWWRPGGA